MVSSRQHPTHLPNIRTVPVKTKDDGKMLTSTTAKVIAGIGTVTLIAAAFAIPMTVLLTLDTSSTRSITTSTTSATTTTAPPSILCVNNTGGRLDNNQFIYSPSQLFAAGMRNNQFAIYRAQGNGNVMNNTIWTASQSSTTQLSYVALQTDGNLVVYTINGAPIWSIGFNNGGVGRPFCLQLFDSGNLVWQNNANTILWQTNSTQSG